MKISEFRNRIKKVNSIHALLALLINAHLSMPANEWQKVDLHNLPSFGGEKPKYMYAVLSWDSEFMLIGETFDWKIVKRDAFDK